MGINQMSKKKIHNMIILFFIKPGTYSVYGNYINNITSPSFTGLGFQNLS